MKVIFLTRYGQQGASSRIRLLQYLSWFESAGISYIVSPLFDDEMLLYKYQHCNYSFIAVLKAYLKRIKLLISRDQFDLIWIEKEALPWLPAWFERLLLRNISFVLDFDDAIFHNYDLHRLGLVRSIYGQRINSLMKSACLIIAGNRYLADRAVSAGAKKVELIPSVVDVARYSEKLRYTPNSKLRIVWIGSPSTVMYLLELSESLASLAKRIPFTLRVVGGGSIRMSGVDVESIDWSFETESAAIAECDIGIMPLRDSPWEQGKCAYKLIQYMACGLPTVCSPIGANVDVVVEGVTGYFASTPSDWISKLEKLLLDSSIRSRLGISGRERIESNFSLQKTAPILTQLINDVGRKD